MYRFPTLLLTALSFARFTAPAAAAPPSNTAMLMPTAQFQRVTSTYGPRGSHFHTGIDLAAPYGSPVRVALGGRITYAGPFFDYGNMVAIRSPDGKVMRYAHLAAVARGVRDGVVLRQGTVLGFVGTSGHAHGAHLHFEIRIHNRPVDPARYLALSLPAPDVEPFSEEVAEAPSSHVAARRSMSRDHRTIDHSR